jgi:hypothetical protein
MVKKSTSTWHKYDDKVLDMDEEMVFGMDELAKVHGEIVSRVAQ